MTEDIVEVMARAIYELEPFYESGEYVDGFPVSPGGDLPWERAQARDAEFGDDPIMGKVCQPAYDAARAALSALSAKGYAVVPREVVDLFEEGATLWPDADGSSLDEWQPRARVALNAYKAALSLPSPEKS